MLAILHFFIDLSLLRRAPQDLPAATALLALVLLAGFVGSLLLALAVGADPLRGAAQSLADFGVTLGALGLALKLVGKPARFMQTATALIGADTLIGLVALLPLSLAAGAATDSPLLLLAGLLFLLLVAWSVLVRAHILRHCFEIKLGQALFIAVAFDLMAFILVGGLAQSGA